MELRGKNKFGVKSRQMKPDKRRTVSFLCELNSSYLFVYFIIYLFFHANSAKKMVLFRQHSCMVETHQSFMHTARLRQLCSSLNLIY